MKKLIAILFTLCTIVAHANNIRLVVPYAPGATVDDIARIIAPELSRKLGKNIVVENKPGASGIIAMEHVASSNPDGLTLVMVNNGVLNMAPVINPSANFTSSSFASIGIVGVAPLVLVTSTSIPPRNIKELTDYIRTNKGTWASPGLGTNLHLLGELYKSQLNLDMTHVMYKGMSPAMIDVAEGRVTMFFDVPNPKMFGFFEANKMKPIAVTSDKRVVSLPEVPTAAEQGFSFLNSHVWFGISVPVSTPDHIVAKLRTALSETIEDADVKEKMKKLGLETSHVKPSDAQRYIDAERVRWTKVMKQANVKASND